MREKLAILALISGLLIAAQASAKTESDVRTLYDRFVAVQNARDVHAVRALFTTSGSAG